MTTKIRLLVGALTALAALVLVSGISARPMGNALPSQRGVADFGLSYASLGPIGSIEHATAGPASGQLKPGLRDFGRSYSEIAVPPAGTGQPQSVATSAASGFDWGAAGIGAAATLGLVLVLSGLAGAVILRSGRRASWSS